MNVRDRYVTITVFARMESITLLASVNRDIQVFCVTKKSMNVNLLLVKMVAPVKIVSTNLNAIVPSSIQGSYVKNELTYVHLLPARKEELVRTWTMVTSVDVILALQGSTAVL